MPDLSVEYYWMCASAVRALFKIKGSKGDEYTVEYHPEARSHPDADGWNCDCKGYQYRHTCKHIQEAKKKQCGWMEFTEGLKPTEVPVDEEHPNGQACPKCGGEVTARGWAV